MISNESFEDLREPHKILPQSQSIEVEVLPEKSQEVPTCSKRASKVNAKTLALSIAQSRKDNGKRKWTKQDNCIYCDTRVTNFTRHLIRKHSKEPNVVDILAKPKGSKERKNMFDNLRKKEIFFITQSALEINLGL